MDAIGEIASCVFRLETYPFSTIYRQKSAGATAPPPPTAPACLLWERYSGDMKAIVSILDIDKN